MFEVNFDGLIGPTHLYGGLSPGNLASLSRAGNPSNPQLAALQSLNKMKVLMDLGIPQAVLPPPLRPNLPLLRSLGWKEPLLPHNVWLLTRLASAAGMYAANVATVSPSIDSGEKHVQLSPANLQTFFHRWQEAPFTTALLKRIFSNPILFTHHDSLPSTPLFADEGSANHLRFCKTHGSPGYQVFVYARDGLQEGEGRASKQACDALIQRHQLYPESYLVVPQNPEAVQKGVFHNDVIATCNQHFFLLHEKAFVNTPEVLKTLHENVLRRCDVELQTIVVQDTEVSLVEAVGTYLFNSQIVTRPNGEMALIAPQECQKSSSVRRFLNHLVERTDTPINSLHFVDLSQAMGNGGGPACLRLKIVLTAQELEALHQPILLTPSLYQSLVAWVKKHYRTSLSLRDLENPVFIQEVNTALHELESLLELKGLYKEFSH